MSISKQKSFFTDPVLNEGFGTYVIINVFGWSVAMFQNVVVVSVIDHKNSPGFEQTVKVGNSSSLILLIPTKRAKLSAFLFGFPFKVEKI